MSPLLNIPASTSCCDSGAKTAASISRSAGCLVEYSDTATEVLPLMVKHEKFVSVPPIHPPCTLTIVAVLLQVLLELVWGEAGVLVHPEVRQAFCRGLCV